MNTEEDEFKRIEREAKRRAQADDDDTQVYADTLSIVYQRGFADGEKAAQQQAEPPPEWEDINNILDEYGLQAIAFVEEWKAAQRPWQGLTDDEIKEIVGPYGDTPIKGYTRKLFDQIEAALRSKNT